MLWWSSSGAQRHVSRLEITSKNEIIKCGFDMGRENPAPTQPPFETKGDKKYANKL
jgi:hypothetical protein